MKARMQMSLEIKLSFLCSMHVSLVALVLDSPQSSVLISLRMFAICRCRSTFLLQTELQSYLHVLLLHW